MDQDKKTFDIAQSMIIMPRLMNYLMGSFKPQLDTPIKKNEIKTLIELAVHPNMPMSFYIDVVAMEKGSFTYLADKLEEKGLVERIHAKDDRRKIVLSLTETGKVVADEVALKFHSHIAEQLGVLDENALKDLNKAICLLENVLNIIEDKK